MGNFNPRPREEGDYLTDIIQEITWGISIHALVKRATGERLIFRQRKGISIHALVKRATLLSFPLPQAQRISIHALVKRATFDELYLTDIIQISIHALVKRATPHNNDSPKGRRFQSTPS